MNIGIRDFSGSRLKPDPAALLSNGLRIATDSATGRITCAADEIILRDGRGKLVILRWPATVVDPARIGVNGSDRSGLNILDGWFYVWAISDGKRVGGVVSNSATSPRLPAGWRYNALVAALFAGSPFQWTEATVVGRRHWITGTPLLSGAIGTTLVNISTLPGATPLSFLIPPNAVHLYGLMGAPTGNRSTIALFSDSVKVQGYVAFVASVTNAVPQDGFGTVCPFSIPITTPQTLYAVGTTTPSEVYVTGYEI